MSPWSSAAPWRPGHGAPAEGSGTSPKAASREAWGGGEGCRVHWEGGEPAGGGGLGEWGGRRGGSRSQARK